MSKLRAFLKKYFKIILSMIFVAILAITLVFYLSSKLDMADKAFVSWIVVGLLLLIITTLFLLIFFIHKKRKCLNDTEAGEIKPDLKAIFRKLNKEGKNIKNIPWILFTSAGESSGDELFSRANFNLLQLNKKQSNGFSVWYSPKFMVLDIGPELFDITSASLPFNKQFSYLLRFLNKKRRHAPINSYVISFPFNYFSHTDPSDLKSNAKNLVKKLEYLQRKLRIRFPAYLLIDRADTVHGFYDYVNTLGEYGYKQMIGWSSNLKINEVLDEKSIDSYFEEFLTNLYKPLYKEQSKQHLKVADSEMATFCFYKTIKDLIPSLKSFIEIVFSNASWNFNPLQLRGLYFTAIKTDNKYSYISYSDTSLQLHCSKVPFDKQSKKFIGIKDNCVFFIEDLFRSKILKESKLITYTSSFLLYMRILRISCLAAGAVAFFLFIYYSFTQTGNLSSKILSVKSKSWNICSNEHYWKNGKFSPILLSSSDGEYTLDNSSIDGKDNIVFIMDFYKQNNIQINIPAVYLLSDWIVGLNKQKNRARNTILYTSIINPLLEALLQEYAVKVNGFDSPTSEIFANTFAYAKYLCDYGAGKECIFPYNLSTRKSTGLNFYIQDTYRYLLKSFDTDTNNKLSLLSDLKIDLHNLFDSDNLPYGIDRSFTVLKKSDFMVNKDVYKSNILKLIDFCIDDYFLGPKSIKTQQATNADVIVSFLNDLESCKRNEMKFYQNLSIDQIIEMGKSLTNLLKMINGINIDIAADKKTIVIGYSILMREGDRIEKKQTLSFSNTKDVVDLDINTEIRELLFQELGLKRNLNKKWFLKEMLTKEQYYLYSPFGEVFNSEDSDFMKTHASQIDSLKSSISYCLALKYLADLVYTYDKQPDDEIIDNIFNLLNNKEIKHIENTNLVLNYLLELAVIRTYLDLLSNFSFPFAFNEFPPTGKLIDMADNLNNQLDNLFQPNIADNSSEIDGQPIKYQEIIKAKQNLPLIIKKWVIDAKAIISFIHANKDFTSKFYLIGHDYTRNFSGNDASNIWVAIQLDQALSEYKSKPALTRTNDNLLLGGIDWLNAAPLKINFYRNLDDFAKHQTKEYLYCGTLPLFKFMINNPYTSYRKPIFKGEYSITWEAAKFDKDFGLWISKISFIDADQKELNMYIGFTMPEGAECIRRCVENQNRELITKIKGK